MVFLASPGVNRGEEVKYAILDYASRKLDRVARSSYSEKSKERAMPWMLLTGAR